MMIPNITVIGLAMKYEILREINAILIITTNQCQIHLLTE